MKAMILGESALELNLCRKLKGMPQISDIYCAPGSREFSGLAWCLDIAADDTENAIAWAKSAGVEFMVITQEISLNAGIIASANHAGIPSYIYQNDLELSSEVQKAHKM